MYRISTEGIKSLPTSFLVKSIEPILTKYFYFIPKCFSINQNLYKGFLRKFIFLFIFFFSK